MKAFQYIRYFFYLSGNWSLPVAIHLIREEIKGEKKYNISTTGADELSSMEEDGIDISHATMYMPASYGLLDNFLSRIHSEYFIDIGCGKGRTLCVAAHKGIKKLTGIDFNKNLCECAKTNLAYTQSLYPDMHYNIVHNDAFYYNIPDDADCIFLFNPFDEIIMSGVVENIVSSIERSPRIIHIIYFNPLHKILFTNAGFNEIYYSKKLNYLEGCILKSPVI